MPRTKINIGQTAFEHTMKSTPTSKVTYGVFGTRTKPCAVVGSYDTPDEARAALAANKDQMFDENSIVVRRTETDVIQTHVNIVRI